jgi:hypothetical protein
MAAAAFTGSPSPPSARLGASPILVIDTRLMFVWYIPCGVLSIASNFERAQRDCAEVSPQGRATASADHYDERGCYGGLGGLALQDVEQTLFMAGCRADG